VKHPSHLPPAFMPPQLGETGGGGEVWGSNKEKKGKGGQRTEEGESYKREDDKPDDQILKGTVLTFWQFDSVKSF